MQSDFVNFFCSAQPYSINFVYVTEFANARIAKSRPKALTRIRWQRKIAEFHSERKLGGLESLETKPKEQLPSFFAGGLFVEKTICRIQQFVICSTLKKFYISSGLQSVLLNSYFTLQICILKRLSNWVKTSIWKHGLNHNVFALHDAKIFFC